MKKYIILIVIILIVIMFYKRKLIEGYKKDPNDEQKDVFDDATYYEYKEGTLSGIYKCWKECTGNCLAWGYSGHGWCFPKN